MDGGINGGGTINLGANSVLDLIGNETLGTSGVGAKELNVTSGAKIALDWGDKITVLNAINGDLNVSSIYIDKTKLSDGETVELFSGAQVGTLSGLENLEFFDTNNKYTVSQNGKDLQLTGSVGGGLSGAVDSTSGKDFVSYTLTGNDETVLTNKTIASTMNIVGDGTETESKSVTLGADLTVADGATAEINDIKLAGTGAINNAATGVLKINNSNVGVRVRNAGILYSDPTTYADTLTNTGVANIDGDTFAATGVLENYNVANLTNATFETGATITGTGTTNLVSGTTAFNSTANSNTVKVASGADFTGALVGGTLDTHNGAIDTISGAFNGGNVVLDAKLGTTPTADRITGNAGTITEINILGTEYGTTNSATLTVGGTLDSNVQINGMNYYTSVVDNGDGTVTFSDKLINKSTLDTTLADYATSGDLTTGLAGKQDTIDAEHKLSASLVDGLSNVATSGNFSDLTVADNAIAMSKVDGLTDALDGKADAATTLSGYGITDAYTKTQVDTALAGKADAATTYTKARVDNAITTALANGSNAYQTASQVDATVSSAISNATIAQSQVTGLTDALDAKLDSATAASTYATQTALNDVSDRVSTLEGAGYQTASDVNTAITNALSTENGGGTIANAIADTAENATFTASTANSNSGSLNGANTVKGAINNVAGAVDTLANNMGKVHGLVSADVNGTKTLNETNNSTNTSNVVGGEYKGNLAVGTTVEDHLIALDNAIGTMSALNTANGVLSNTASVATNLQSLDNAAASNAQKIQKIVDGTTTVAKATDATNAVNATNDGQGRNIASTYATLQLVNDTVGDMATVSGTHVSNTASVATNLNQLSAAIDSISADSIAAANSYTDKRVESLDKNLSAGVAGAVALSSVAVSGVERGEVSVGAGYGYFNGQSAAAVGAAMGLSNRWSINAGAGISNADVSFRAGTNYKFKLF
jgi:hypothetical protein